MKKYNGKEYNLVDGDHRKSLMEERLISRRKKFPYMSYRLYKNGDIWLIYGRHAEKKKTALKKKKK